MNSISVCEILRGIQHSSPYLALEDPGRPLQPEPDASAAVEARGLVRRYGSTVAVDHLDLSVRRGEIYGFLGPNGAGKSTAVRVMCTLLRPSEGRVVVAGHDVVTEAGEVRRRVGVALQEAALDDRQTGRELLTLQGRLYRLSARRSRERVAEVLDLVDIGEAIDRRIATYSGGMRRRLDLAAALVHEPEVLFLDEPTTGLDPHSRATVWSEILRLNHELAMSIFLTTQYLEEADALAPRVGIMDRGRLAAEGSPAELKRIVGRDVIVAEVGVVHDGALERLRQRLRDEVAVEALDVDGGHVRLSTSDGPATVGPFVVALEKERMAVLSLTMRSPTLDDVFLRLTGAPVADD